MAARGRTVLRVLTARADHPSHPSVLVIEDDLDIREALLEALALEGYRVTAAQDGAEGLARARALRPDLIVLDLMMPVMDGFEFLGARGADEGLSATPVIVVTARHPAEVEGCEVLHKPFDLDALLAAARRSLATAACAVP
jgi:CheY-like chemotaxis protein